MSDHVYADWLTENDLRSVLLSLPSGLEWMILEAVDEIINLRPFQNEIDVARFDNGRVFGAECELRWQRDGPLYHTMLVGNVSAPPIDIAKHHQELDNTTFERDVRDYYVWGEWSTDIPEWIEARIPHIFDYPKPPEEGNSRWRYKLKAIEYVNGKSGEMEFYRYTGTVLEKL